MKSLWRERYKTIKHLRENGVSYRKIGLMMGVTGERVAAIYKKGKRIEEYGECPCSVRLYNALCRWSRERIPCDRSELAKWLTNVLNDGMPPIRNIGVKSMNEIENIVGRPITYVDHKFRFAE